MLYVGWALPTILFLAPFMTSFQKIPTSMLHNRRPQHLLDAVSQHIEQFVDYPRNSVNLDRLPSQAQKIYWLWRFQCEAGVCGMDKFILDDLGIYSQQIHAALGEIGANELAHLLEIAVALARQSNGAEFKRLSDQSWFNQFSMTDGFTELHMLNRPTFALMSALTELIVSYIKTNTPALFAD